MAVLGGGLEGVAFDAVAVLGQHPEVIQTIDKALTGGLLIPMGRYVPVPVDTPAMIVVGAQVGLPLGVALLGGQGRSFEGAIEIMDGHRAFEIGQTDSALGTSVAILGCLQGGLEIGAGDFGIYGFVLERLQTTRNHLTASP